MGSCRHPKVSYYFSSLENKIVLHLHTMREADRVASSSMRTTRRKTRIVRFPAESRHAVFLSSPPRHLFIYLRVITRKKSFKTKNRSVHCTIYNMHIILFRFSKVISET